MREKLKVVGRRVKFLRMEKGYSQTELAEAIGTSQTNLSNMESGRAGVTLSNLFKISEALDCNMYDFFVDFDPPIMKDKRTEITIEEALRLLKTFNGINVKGL